MLQSMDELIIAGTSSLSQAIKSIQCLRQHELPHQTWQKPHHTWQKPSPCVGKHDVLTAPDRCYYLNQAYLPMFKAGLKRGKTNRSQTATDVVMVIK